uniref:Uncharacterized protein n=1 Tax=Rhizophora mucronata TaxID=61149 RepID=A0A2P2QSU7_RHIMU
MDLGASMGYHIGTISRLHQYIYFLSCQQLGNLQPPGTISQRSNMSSV